MSKCENLIKFLTLIAFTASLAFVLNSCKSGLKARCSTAVIDYVDDRLKKGLQCYELGQSEEKKGKFEKAFLYYETACKLIAPNNACAKLSEIKPKVPKPKCLNLIKKIKNM